MIDLDLLRKSPKVVLHDHLDGGLRLATIVELADAIGHQLPTSDVDELAAWFLQGGEGSDLVSYLAAFDQTVALLQTPEAIARVTAECVEDLAAEGVVYAEIRYAPELSTPGGLSLDEALAAMDEGARTGAAGRDIEVGLLACVMHQADRADEVIAAAIRSRDAGSRLVGVDLAGPEAGFPAARHAKALSTAADAALRITLHAGEADGPASVADALDHGAERLGHGVRIIEDIDADGAIGPVAQRVLDHQIPLEVCPTSNVHTGVVGSVADHPFARLRELGFRVTLSTDNRLMSGVTATSELAAVTEAFGYGLDELEEIAMVGAASAFCGAQERVALAARVQRGFAALRP